MIGNNIYIINLGFKERFYTNTLQFYVLTLSSKKSKNDTIYSYYIIFLLIRQNIFYNYFKQIISMICNVKIILKVPKFSKLEELIKVKLIL